MLEGVISEIVWLFGKSKRVAAMFKPHLSLSLSISVSRSWVQLQAPSLLSAIRVPFAGTIHGTWKDLVQSYAEILR